MGGSGRRISGSRWGRRSIPGCVTWSRRGMINLIWGTSRSWWGIKRECGRRRRGTGVIELGWGTEWCWRVGASVWGLGLIVSLQGCQPFRQHALLWTQCHQNYS